MSDLELATFLFLEWSQEIIDIREQFPLKFDETLPDCRKYASKVSCY